MKIAVEITFFGETISRVLDYPGTPQSQHEVIQWLMYQTDYRWTDYENAPQEDKLLYHVHKGTVN